MVITLLIQTTNKDNSSTSMKTTKIIIIIIIKIILGTIIRDGRLKITTIFTTASPDRVMVLSRSMLSNNQALSQLRPIKKL